ncbi:rod shape-determining protein MreC [Candidatus Shapirobacteria bacterium]|nr:rod shape-determining protein MreC [Candidatus Shapirobacteria bacterium]
MREQNIRRMTLIFLVLLFISLLLFLLDRQGWLLKTKGFLGRPFFWLEEKIFTTHQGLFSRLGNWGLEEKEQEIMLLQGKLRQLAVDQNQLSVCLEENEKIKKLLGSPLPSSWRFQEAKVVGFAERLRIDKGSQESVGEGMMVVSENILVGKVIVVEENSSLVQRLNDPVSKIPVVVKKPGGSGFQGRGLLSGQGKNKLVLDRVFQGEDIQKGDLVATSGDEGWLPDLVIGQIQEVLPKSAEVYQRAQVRPLLDYDQLRIVFVIIR